MQLSTSQNVLNDMYVKTVSKFDCKIIPSLQI